MALPRRPARRYDSADCLPLDHAIRPTRERSCRRGTRGRGWKIHAGRYRGRSGCWKRSTPVTPTSRGRTTRTAWRLPCWAIAAPRAGVRAARQLAERFGTPVLRGGRVHRAGQRAEAALLPRGAGADPQCRRRDLLASAELRRNLRSSSPHPRASATAHTWDGIFAGASFRWRSRDARHQDRSRPATRCAAFAQPPDLPPDERRVLRGPRSRAGASAVARSSSR
jgi:hypothetical protein